MAGTAAVAGGQMLYRFAVQVARFAGGRGGGVIELHIRPIAGAAMAGIAGGRSGQMALWQLMTDATRRCGLAVIHHHIL